MNSIVTHTTDTHLFLSTLFHSLSQTESGDVELRIFENSRPRSVFSRQLDDIADQALAASQQQADVYFGVNPRVGRSGKKENIHYLTAFHIDLDYGSVGHKKNSPYLQREDAWSALQNFALPPTLIVHSGGGFHAYWVLQQPLLVAHRSVEKLEAVNQALSRQLGGDGGTHDLGRILRLPGTLNYKVLSQPRLS